MHAPLLVSLLLAILPDSKLGGYIAFPGGATAGTIATACPRVILYQLPDLTVVAAVNALRTACPQTQIVLRTNVAGTKYTTADDPAAKATEYWNLINGDLAPFTGQALVDWVEGPWELDNLPDWTQSDASGTWVATFYGALADHIHDAGYNPLVGVIPPGQPLLASGTKKDKFQPIADAMKAKTYKWGWSYHAFTVDLTSDAAAQALTMLRYRTISADCKLAGKPIIISAAGYGDPGKNRPGWASSSVDIDNYFVFLKWFDARVREDTDVVGVAVFQFGNSTTLASYNLDAFASALATYIKDFRLPGLDAGVAGEDAAASGEDAAASDAAVEGDAAVTANDAAAPLDGGRIAGPDAAGSTTGPVTHGGIPSEGGCASAGVGAIPALAGLVALALLRRRRE